MRNRLVKAPRLGGLATIVTAAWAALACALVAEFAGWNIGGGKCAGSHRAGLSPATAPVGGGGGGSGNMGSSLSSSSANSSSDGPTWQDVDALILQPAMRHGRQVKQKGGVPANLQLLLIHMTNKNANLHGVPEGIGPAMFRWFAHAFT